jgi:hypothetical protein
MAFSQLLGIAVRGRALDRDTAVVFALEAVHEWASVAAVVQELRPP